jgi:RimJ/RimL family protein N-acetyltransferase
VIETERLILRRWREADRAPHAAMMADPHVGDWLGGTETRVQADDQIDRREDELTRSGWGLLAIERKADGLFIGCAGLRPVDASLPVAPAIEIGWRLARHAWGAGHASEAARALLDDGFTRRRLTEIAAFTARTNLRSRAVMTRLGMTREPSRDFDHPGLPADHPLRRHVVYLARAGCLSGG